MGSRGGAITGSVSCTRWRYGVSRRRRSVMETKMTEKIPYILVRMICSDRATLGSEFDMVVEQHSNASVCVRSVPVLRSPHLKHGRLLRPGEPEPARPPLATDKLKNFRFAPTYSGCPYCRTSGALMCDCGAISCASPPSVIGFRSCAACGRKNLAVKVDWLAADVNNRG